jgi:hypothetical protein
MVTPSIALAILPSRQQKTSTTSSDPGTIVYSPAALRLSSSVEHSLRNEVGGCRVRCVMVFVAAVILQLFLLIF